MLYEILENKAISYVIGLAGNPRLKLESQALMGKAVAQYDQTGQKQRLFCVFEYRAKSWHKSRTVIAKTEASRNGTNLRFVVTNQ